MDISAHFTAHACEVCEYRVCEHHKWQLLHKGRAAYSVQVQIFIPSPLYLVNY